LHCLLDNAWNSATKKRSLDQVGLLPGKRADELTLVVANNGAGFDPVCSGNLFTAFQRSTLPPEMGWLGLKAIIKRYWRNCMAVRHGLKARPWAQASSVFTANATRRFLTWFHHQRCGAVTRLFSARELKTSH
jgi:light-regulated signal transduction histidine kinase (bacteriophytochrome)